MRRSFVMGRISSGGAPVGKRFRYIDSQCPLVTSRNIAELQHVATTRRVGESGLSRCSSRYSCPITHCTTVGIEHGRRGSQLLEPASGFLAARTIAGAGKNRRPNCLEFHLAALAYRGKVLVLLLVHCDFPSLDHI